MLYNSVFKHKNAQSYIPKGKKIRHREKMKAVAFSINKEMMFYFLNIALVSFQ